MYVLWHCIVEVCHLFFNFSFAGGYKLDIVLSLRRGLDFGIWKCFEVEKTMGTFEVWPSVFLQYGMATSL